MLSKSLIFCVSILTMLFVLIAYFTETVAAQQVDKEMLIDLPDASLTSNGFIVYGRAPSAKDAGIVETVVYKQALDLNSPKTLPDLELFFLFGGTLELLMRGSHLSKGDIVISEIMWGRDTSYRRITEKNDPAEPPHDLTTYTQWIELYNTIDDQRTANLLFLFTPFENHPDRELVAVDGSTYRVLDAVSTLDLGKWELPGRTGRRPSTDVASAYRDIVYTEADGKRAVVPFGSSESSWKATQEYGRRNTLVSFVDTRGRITRLPYIATPGAPHVLDILLEAPEQTDVDSDRVVINEVRNDLSRDNFDWVELKNVSRSTIPLENWELSVVTGVGQDKKLVDLPDYDLASGEILLLQREHPELTILANGIDVAKRRSRPVGATHKYFVAPELELPNTHRFVLLLRSESDKTGQDAAIEDYAGNGFFVDTSFAFNTKFWPRKGQPAPTDVANFGVPTFSGVNRTWARHRYDEGDGHHKDAWQVVGDQGGIGYDPGVDRLTSPGTPGYENSALKTRMDDDNARTSELDDEYNDGQLSISEIMYHLGPNRNHPQWIELYNSSMTQAVNLKGWELEVRNLADKERWYAGGSCEFEDLIILPNQVVLLVVREAATDIPSNRVYDLYQRHGHDLGLILRSDYLLSPTAFYVKLTDKGDPDWDGDDIVVDEVGNLKIEQRERIKLWNLPEIDPEYRRSIVRAYGGLFKPNKGGLDGRPSPPANGLSAAGWHPFPNGGMRLTFYGSRRDLASPGSRRGGPVPVVLSSFRPMRLETGEVRIEWQTESELNNAGFNILRSENSDGNFKVINATGMIPGHGTTGERHLYTYMDTTAKPNVIYYYRIEDISFDGVRQTLATARLKGDISASGKLSTTWSNLKSQR